MSFDSNFVYTPSSQQYSSVGYNWDPVFNSVNLQAVWNC